MTAPAQSQQGITLPNWLEPWPSVIRTIRRIEAGEFTGGSLSNSQRMILLRLATDKHMRNVWSLLTSQNRQTGKFAYPACPAVEGQNAEENQGYYLGLTLYTIFRAASEERTAGKNEDVQALREKFNRHAKVLREVANDIRVGWQTSISDGSSVISQRDMAQDLADADALMRIADAREQQVFCLRDDNDPMTITNNRGDPLIRGVAITMAAFFLKHFGKRLDRTAATLAGAALNTRISERAVRSAFS